MHNNAIYLLFLAGEHCAFLHIFFTSPWPDAMAWRGKCFSLFFSFHTPLYFPVFNFWVIFCYFCNQAIVFGSLYSKNLLRNKPQGLPTNAQWTGTSTTDKSWSKFGSLNQIQINLHTVSSHINTVTLSLLRKGTV